MSKSCVHTRIKVGAYRDYWRTDCGKTYGISGPVEVGMGFNPDPTGKFCSNCGKQLVVDRWSKVEVRDE